MKNLKLVPDDGQTRSQLPNCRPSIHRAFHSAIPPIYLTDANGPTDIFRVPRWRWRFTLVLAGSQEASCMWGMIAKITLLPHTGLVTATLSKFETIALPRGIAFFTTGKDRDAS